MGGIRESRGEGLAQELLFSALAQELLSTLLAQELRGSKDWAKFFLESTPRARIPNVRQRV